MLKFQTDVMGRLSKFELGNLPNSICIVGERGSGKSSLIEWIVSQYPVANYVKVDKVDSDFTNIVLATSCPTFYHIMIREQTEKKQNILLKILEEPPRMVYLILEADSKFQLIQTVLNRVQIFEMGQYSQSALKEFLTDQTFDISACRTPGDVLSLTTGDNNTLPDFTRSIFSNIHKASYGSILNIPSRFKDFNADGKYSFDLFTRLLLKYCSTLIGVGKVNAFNAYELTQTFVKDCSVTAFDKRRLLEHYLFMLKGVMIDARS